MPFYFDISLLSAIFANGKADPLYFSLKQFT